MKLNKIVQDWYIYDGNDSINKQKNDICYVYDKIVHLVDRVPTLLSLIKQTILLHTRTKSDDHDDRKRSLDSLFKIQKLIELI